MVVAVSIIVSAGQRLLSSELLGGKDRGSVPSTDEGIFHVRGTRRMGDESTDHELWFDPRSGWIRHQSGQHGKLSYQGVYRNGVIDHFWVSSGTRRRESGLVSDENLPLLGGELLRYRVLAERPSAESVWRSAGQDSGLIRFESRVVDGVQRVVWVDSINFLPQKEEERYGDSTVNLVAWEYEIVDWLPREGASATLFVLPSAVPAVQYERLSIDGARSFDQFPVYYLGDEFEGMTASASYEIEPQADGDAIFSVFYNQNKAQQPRVTLVQRSADEYRPRTYIGAEVAGIQRVVQGRQMTVYAASDRTAASVELVTERGTWITIFGSSADLRMAAAGSLRELNAAAGAEDR
jgi:hypothetical protein